MLHALHDWIERRRSRKAIISMVTGLLRTADDWAHTKEHDGIFRQNQILTSKSLKVTLKWVLRDGFNEYFTSDWKLVLGGEVTSLPPEVAGALQKATDKLLAELRQRAKDEQRAGAEHTLAKWVVENHRAIRRVEMGTTLPAPKELRGGQLVLDPRGLTTLAPIGHQWCGKWITAYEPGPDWYRLEDGSTVSANEVRQAIRFAA